MKYFLSVVLLILFTASLAYSGNIKGIIKDQSTDEPLIGANIIIIGTGMGATTDLDGFFLITNVPDGDYKIDVSYIGYHSHKASIAVSVEEVNIEISLEPMVYSGAEITILADRAKPRETPVAYSNVEKKEIQEKHSR